MAIASGSIAYTDTYSVDENTKDHPRQRRRSMFPNLVEATSQRWIVMFIIADEMKFTNPARLPV
jgi:hypothetical protein